MRGVTALWHLPRLLLIGLVRGYRLLLSPWVGQSCRFTPTCSIYAIQALRTHGALVGTGLAGWRILRCNPWCQGGCDAVPDNRPWGRSPASPSAHPAAGLFSGLLHPDSGVEPAAAPPEAAATDK
jgi:putative membrane protein insertion efficiency factor